MPDHDLRLIEILRCVRQVQMVSQPVLEPKARKTRFESVPMKIPGEKNYGK